MERSEEIKNLITSNNQIKKEKEDLESKISHMKSLISEITHRLEIEMEKQKNTSEEISEMIER